MRITGVFRLMTDHRSRARDQQLAGRRARGAGKRGSDRAVLTRIRPRTDLARILDRHAFLARRQSVDLQGAYTVATSDRGCRRIAVAGSRAQASCPATAEVPIALVVAVAFVDRIHVVPQTQDVAMPTI